MAIIVVYTDKGQQVWQTTGVHRDSLSAATCPTNAKGSAIIAGLRRAVEDAEKIERDEDPERPSEKAMRLSEREWS